MRTEYIFSFIPSNICFTCPLGPNIAPGLETTVMIMAVMLMAMVMMMMMNV